MDRLVTVSSVPSASPPPASSPGRSAARRPRGLTRLLAPLLLAGAMAGCATMPPPPPPLGYDEIAQRVAAKEPDAQIVRDIRVRGVAGGSPPATENMAKLEAAGASEAVKDAVLIAAWQPPGSMPAEPVAVGPAPWWGGYPGPYYGPYPSWGWGPWPGYGYYGPAVGVGIYGGWRGGTGYRHPSVVAPPPGARPSGGVGSPFRPSFPRPVQRR